MHLESKARRGMVLFIVVAMLALFAVVSVAFYYYATQESMASRLTLDAQQRLRPDPDALFAYALRQLVFGTSDNTSISPFVKYSLLRNLFGDQGSDPFSAQTETTSGIREQLVDTTGNPPSAGVPLINPPLINPPYTYPDEIHAMLGRLAIDSLTGQLVALDRSFVRQYTLQQQYYNPNKIHNQSGWFYIGRPKDLGPLFDPGGDVRNLPPGIPVKLPTGQLHYGNDSIWMDLGFPVQTGPDGRTYKPLFAFFITELDSRLDLNAFAKSFRYAKSSGTGVNRGLPPTVSPLPLGLLELESLYRHGDTGADAFASVLFGKGDTDLLAQLKNSEFRHSLTLNSSDLMWAGLWPLGYSPSSGSSPTGQDYDTAKGRLWPLPFSPWYTSPWRLIRRLNLKDVKLTLAGATLADKQRLARDIYFRLLVATGKLWDIYDPKPPTASWKRLPNDPTFRELAQIAVNMVDYLDPDDEPTPFFYACDVDGNPLPDPSGGTVNPNEIINASFPDQTLQIPKYQVYGIELPRLVINEVLAEYQAPLAGTAGPVTVRVWVELWYPPMNEQLLSPPYTAAFNPIPLGKLNGTNSAYRLVLAAANPNYAAGTASPMYITEGLTIPASANEAPNVVGVPAEARNWNWTDNKLDWDDAAFDNAGLTALAPNDFLIIGPSGDTEDGTLGPKPRVQTDSMKYTLYQNAAGAWVLYDTATGSPTPWAADDKTSGILVLLQRLRDPSSPHDPVNNPYITVDWVHLPGAGLRNRTGGANSSVSYIRVKANKVQGAADGNTLQQGSSEPSPAATTQHSLGAANKGRQSALPQDLIVHLNGIPSTSALDLLFVSGLKPYEVSNKFDSYNGGFNSPYLAPWFKGTPPYHRFFELVDLGSANSHRISGRLNLHAALRNNGKFDLSNFKSLVDLWKTNPPANFGRQEAKNVWDNLANQVAKGSPFYGMGIDNLNQSWLAPGPLPSPPAWYLALGATPTYDYFVDTDGDGIPDQGLFDYSEDNDITHSDTGAPRPHPYNQSADTSALAGRLWSKITTRSNVFAVWCTVGFFEVDQNGKLGPEIDADVGRQVRYRFFAIVDRTIIAEWMLQNNKPVETQLGRTDIDPRRTGPNGEPPCVIYWSRIQ
jgi:hypothetical protein